MAAHALLPSSAAHTCLRPRSTPLAHPQRRQQVACQGYRNRGGFYGPGPGMFGMGMGPWAPFVNGLGDKTIAQLLQDLEREMNRVNAEYGRRGERGERSTEGRRSGSGGGWQQAEAPVSSDLQLAVDSVETDDAYVYYADVPGLLKSDLKIRVNQQDRVLTVSGDRQQPEAASVSGSDSEESSRFQRRWERRFGSFKRELPLPESADLQAISAKVDKGVLRIRVLKEIKRASPAVDEIQID